MILSVWFSDSGRGGRDVLFARSAPVNGDIEHWQMSIPWDWTTLTDTGEVFSTGLNWGSGGTVSMRPDNRKVIATDPPNDLIIEYVLDKMEKDPSVEKHVKGFMVESFLISGNQKLPNTPEELECGK